MLILSGGLHRHGLARTLPNEVCVELDHQWERSGEQVVRVVGRGPSNAATNWSSSTPWSTGFAADRTRATTLERVLASVDDLGCATYKILTDRDPAICVGATAVWIAQYPE